MPTLSKCKVDRVSRGDAGRGVTLKKDGPPPVEETFAGISEEEYDDLREACLHGKEVTVEYTEDPGPPPTKDITSVMIHG